MSLLGLLVPSVTHAMRPMLVCQVRYLPIFLIQYPIPSILIVYASGREGRCLTRTGAPILRFLASKQHSGTDYEFPKEFHDTGGSSEAAARVEVCICEVRVVEYGKHRTT